MYFESPLKLHTLDCKNLKKLLPTEIPSWWKGQQCVPWGGANPSREWLLLLWKFISKEKKDYTFKKWTLIPTSNLNLVRVGLAKSVIHLDNTTPAHLRSLLERAECFIFADIFDNEGSPKHLVSEPTPSGLCCALAMAPNINSHIFSRDEALVSVIPSQMIRVGKSSGAGGGEWIASIYLDIKYMLRKALRSNPLELDSSKLDLEVIKKLKIFPTTQNELVAISSDANWKCIHRDVAKQYHLTDSFLVLEDEFCKDVYQQKYINIITRE